MALMRQVSESNAINYYYEDDHIFAQSGESNSAWQGSGAKELKLNVEVKKTEFERVLKGQNPINGETLVQSGVNNTHRAAMDFVFSAPKSVSIQALHLKDNQVIEAHNDAVSKSIEFIESIVTARETKDGNTELIKTGNVVAATFNHSVSRSLDPQLHTHAVVANMTETNSDWKAISNESLFLSQNLINQVYQNHLANILVEAGYNIDRKSSSFELSGYKQEWLDTFSKRSNEVNNYLITNIEELKEKYPNASKEELIDIARLASRDEKDSSIDEKTLRNSWESQLSKDSIINSINSNKSKIQDHSILKAAELITENQSYFSKDELASKYLQLNVGGKTIDDFNKEFSNSKRSTHIQNIGSVNTRIGSKTINLNTTLYTTKETIELEKSVINKLENQKEITPFLQKDTVDIHLQNSNLTDGQKQLIEHIATTKNSFSFVQGDAGTGKTFALDQLAKIINEEPTITKIIGASFTGKAAAEIENKTSGDIKSYTIHSLLNKWNNLFDNSQKTILVIDEASMISTKQFSEVINNAENTNTKVIFIGDSKQLQPVEAGQIFKDGLAKFGANVELNENLRQKNEFTKSVVNYTKQYIDNEDKSGISKAVSLLNSNEKIYENSSFDKALSKAVDDYVSCFNDGEQPLLITHTNEIKDTLNEQIREQILPPDKEQFELTVRELSTIRDTEKFSSHNYSEHQSIFICESFEHLQAGSEWHIENINHENNSLDVSNTHDFSAQIDLNEYGNNLSVFNETDKSFAIGDRIIFQKNDSLLGVKNGQVGNIEDYNNATLTIKTENNETISFSSDTYNYLDHGYALTVHKSQGQTAESVQYVTESNSKMINSESFYVAMTRATDDINIYTDDTSKLVEKAGFSENEYSFHELLEKTERNEQTTEKELIGEDTPRNNIAFENQ